MAVIGTLMSAAAFCTAAMTPDWPIGATAIVAAIYGVSAAGYLPVLLGEVARRAPHGEIGALTSGAQLFPLAGCILGPLAFGGMAAILGMPAAFVLAGTTTLAGAVILGAPDKLFAEWIAIVKPSKPGGGPLPRKLSRRFEQ
jgi:MFS family permease